MSEWTKEQLEEMFGDDVVEQLSFLSGCTKHSYSDPKNPELNGFIISHDSLYKFAELIVQECTELLYEEAERLYSYSSECDNMRDSDEAELCAEKCMDNIKMIEKHFGVE